MSVVDLSSLEIPVYKKLYSFIDCSVAALGIKGKDLKIILLEPPFLPAEKMYESLGAPYTDEVVRLIIAGNLYSKFEKVQFMTLLLNLYFPEELFGNNNHVGSSPFPISFGNFASLLNVVYKIRELDTKEYLALRYLFVDLIKEQSWSDEIKEFIFNKVEQLNNEK